MTPHDPFEHMTHAQAADVAGLIDLGDRVIRLAEGWRAAVERSALPPGVKGVAGWRIDQAVLALKIAANRVEPHAEAADRMLAGAVGALVDGVPAVPFVPDMGFGDEFDDD